MTRDRTIHPLRRHYGAGPQQIGHLHVSRQDPEHGTIVLFHGGFWRPHRGLSMTSDLATSLTRVGWNVWNVEYRRVGQGGWRDTLADSLAAVEHVEPLGAEFGIDTARLVIVGHSAGGHLATWVTQEATRSGRAVQALVTLNGVLSLQVAADLGVGDDAVTQFLGTDPDVARSAFPSADPIARLPMGTPIRCLHSRDDERVPYAVTASFTEAAASRGDDVELIDIEGHHTAPIEVGSAAWQKTMTTIESVRAGQTKLSLTQNSSSGHSPRNRKVTP